MGCTYSAQRKVDPGSVMKGRIIGLDDEIRGGGGGGGVGRGNGGGGGPRYVNNLRGGSIKEVSSRGDMIPGFT